MTNIRSMVTSGRVARRSLVMDRAHETVHAFNDAINARDLDALMARMTPDHRFIDAGGASVDGRGACAEAWRGFFSAFPDYRNVFEDLCTTDDGLVLVVGRSECSVPELDGPARWRVVVAGDQVSVWQVGDASSG